MFERGVGDLERPVARGWKFPDAVALGQWVNPVLGLSALVLAGYLTIGHPATTIVTTSASPPVAQVATPVLAQLTPGNETAIISDSSVAHDETTRSSMIDLLNAALGTVAASAWVIGGVWVGIRSARISIPLDDPKGDPNLGSAARPDGRADARYQARLQ
jgi:hypothetical protein